jgi:hypothetical protein
MTMYIKKKDNRPAVPKICFRCQTRLGETQLRVVEVASDIRTPASGELWLCSTCVAEIQGVQPNNS